MSRPRMSLILGLLASMLVPAAGMALGQTPAPPRDSESAALHAAPTPSLEQDLQVARSLSRAFNHAAEVIAPSVVHITQVRQVRVQRNWFDRMPTQESIRTGSGSGVVVSDDGYILTNNHVVENSDRVEVQLNDGRKFDGRVVGSDLATDLSVVKIEAGALVPATFGDSDGLQVGDWVLAVGSPFGLFDNTVTAGIVSAKGRTGLAGPTDAYQDFIQTDAAINPGNSGGPLVNIDGQVVGINSQIASRSGGFQGLGFAIPSAIAEPVMHMLLRNGRVERGWVGMVMQPITPALAPEVGTSAGVFVQELVPGGPAERAGLQPGDVVVRFNGRAMDNMNRLRTAIAMTEPGAEARVELLRNGQRVQLTVQVADSTEGRALTPGGRGLKAYGFTVGDIPPRFRRQLGGIEGVVVMSIDERSPAAQGELRVADVIVHVNGAPVISAAEFDAVIQGVTQRPVRLNVVRPATGQTGYVQIAPRG